MNPLKDVHDKQWGKSIQNMKGSSGSEQLVMMELFLSNLMREENFEHLLKEFIPQLEELEGLAENVVLGLSLANSLALQEAKEDTFDNLLQQLDSSKDEAVHRVILKDEHGQALVTKLKSKNTTLQDRFSKALKVGVFGEMLNDNATADAATFIEIMQGVAELGVTEADLENNELKTSFNRICSAFLDLSTKVLAGCGDLDPIFASLDGDSAIFTMATDILESNAITEMKSVAAVWNMPSVTKMFTVATANPGSVPGMLVDLSQVVPWLAFSSGTVDLRAATLALGALSFQRLFTGRLDCSSWFLRYPVSGIRFIFPKLLVELLDLWLSVCQYVSMSCHSL